MTSTGRHGRIVVGVDGSQQSIRALRWAARIAEATGSTLDAVAAWEYPVSYGWSSVPDDWYPAGDMHRMLTETVDEVFDGKPPPGLQLKVCEGHAARVLLDESEGATMLVVGSRGHGGFAGLLLGSVSAHVAEHATCPVLVVHDGDETATGPAAGAAQQ